MKRHKKQTEAIRNFWSKINKTDTCWLWQGAISSKGYGRMRQDGKHISTHRYIFKMAYGEIPDGLFVLHDCDTPACVRPAHLFLGTQQDNIDDMINKGRKAIGSKVNSSKLKESDIPTIRKRLNNGEISSDIAIDYGVTSNAIAQIKTGKTWKHIQ